MNAHGFGRLGSTLIILLASGACLGCGDDEGVGYPYPAGQSTVIGALSSDGAVPTSRATPSGEGCLEVVGKDGEIKCLKPQKDCGEEGTADVIVDEDGAVLTVICYPNRDYQVQEIGTAPVQNPTLGNNSVIVLDGEDDGDDVEGDLHIVGNNVIVYGQGPERSVIGGDLVIDKNNAIVRGVRAGGNVQITKNNASLLDCAIEGDLTITGNNVAVALCEVWGQITIEGNNAVFVSNRVAGDQRITGKNLRCNDVQRFSDSDGDAVVDEAEVLTTVTCNP